MSFTLRLVFAATFLSIVLDGSTANAQYRRPQRGGNSSALSNQMLGMFYANQQRNWAMVNNGRAPVYRPIPNAAASPRYTPLPDPASAGARASYYGTQAVGQLGTGNYRQGVQNGAKSLYNAHNAAAGYSARSLPLTGPTGYSTLGQQAIPAQGGYNWDSSWRNNPR